MTKNKTLFIRARVTSRANASAYLKQPGDAVIVDRQGPRWLVLSCPCGCGAEVPVNLDRRAGPAWRIYESPKGTSIYPSVWRDTDCKSHFIIWRDDILMFGQRYGESWIDEADAGEDGDESDHRRNQEAVQGMLGRLNDRERQILVSRYGIGGASEQTLEQLGRVLGITKERVRQIESRAQEKLRKFALEQKIDHPAV